MHRTFKMVTVVGTSPTSFDEAVERAIADASGSLRHLGWFEVEDMRGRIEDGKIHEYQVRVNIGFRLESE